MLNKENINLCYDVLSHYGVSHQQDKVIEECAELIDATCKMRDRKMLKCRDDFIGELIDVIVMCQQMLLVERLPMDEVNEMAKVKLERALQNG